ncbi:MAG: sigma-54-dependent Fis family transcriptional regulator [Asticcacaulis sp.]|nr:sigma-54-dependent Fis family transcriptional regulator [Asticcacaulis sp.]
MSARKILFIDDDPGVVKTAQLLLQKAGYEFLSAHHPDEAYSLLAAESVDVILLDLNFSRSQMSGEEGLACLREIRHYNPNAVVIVVTGHSGLTIAVQALKAGAQNFIMKPWNNERLLSAIEEALGSGGPENVAVPAADTGLMVGGCEAILRIKELIARYAPLTASVLLRGEAGTGKSLAAQALHRQSGRQGLKIIEAASLGPEDLDGLEDTTVVLETVEHLPPSMSRFLLSWLETAGRNGNRLVATTLRDDDDMGVPRDLLYALSTLEMTLPPLRDRGDDVERLAVHFAAVFARKQRLQPRILTPDATAALKAESWTDNLHALRRAMAAIGPAITLDDLAMPAAGAARPDIGLNLDQTEKLVIEAALKRHNFNISKAATALGLTRQTLYRRMAYHGF